MIDTQRAVNEAALAVTEIDDLHHADPLKFLEMTEKSNLYCIKGFSTQ